MRRLAKADCRGMASNLLAAPEEAFHRRDLVKPAQNENRDRQIDHEISTERMFESRPGDAAAPGKDRKRNAQSRGDKNDETERLCGDRFVKMQPSRVSDARCQPATGTG